MSAEVRNANMLSGGPPKKTTRTYFGKVKMACKFCRSRRSKCIPTSSSTCARCLRDGRSCVYQRPSEDQREERRLLNALKRCRRIADSSSEESESLSSCGDEEDEDYIGVYSTDRQQSGSTGTMEQRRVRVPSGIGSNPKFAQLMAEFQKGLDSGKSGEAQASTISPGQPGFAERIVRALSPETTSPPPKRRKQSTRPSWGTRPIGTSISSNRQSSINANPSDSTSVPESLSSSMTPLHKPTNVGTAVSDTEPNIASNGPTPPNSQRHSMPPPPSPSPEYSVQARQQRVMLKIHLVGDSKHKIVSLRKCSQTPSLFSEIVKNFPIRELDVQKLCFTFAWKPYGDSERTLELEDEFDIVGVDYLCELIKDAPCWSELGGGLRSMCLIEVDITASQTRSEEMFASKSRVSESR